MPCYCPLQAWQPVEGGKVVFVEKADHRPLTLACGQCIGCRLERSRQWAVRCVHESQMHALSSFVTLTYDEDHCPRDLSLRYSDFQLFMKRLRSRLGKRVPFYMCGEYGGRTKRPHFHACLFGVYFPDRVVHSELRTGYKLYRSDFLSSIWTDGFASVGDFSFDTAAYCARYVCDKVTGDLAHDHYRRLDLDSGEVYYVVPEFNRMSLRPAIGATWFSHYMREVYPRDEVVINGAVMKPPRYYDKLLELVDVGMREDVAFARELNALDFASDCTTERLRARAIVARARLALKCRPLE